MYASKTIKEKFSGPGENCQRNVTDLVGSLVRSSRPPGRPQKRPDDRTWNAGVAVRTADGSRRTADAGDEQCLRCGMQPSVMYCGALRCRHRWTVAHRCTQSAPADERPASADLNNLCYNPYSLTITLGRYPRR